MVARAETELAHDVALEAQRQQLPAALVAAAGCTRNIEHADQGLQVGSGQAQRGLATLHRFDMDLSRELLAQPTAVGAGGKPAAIVVAGLAEALPRETGLIGKIIDTVSQQRGAGVKRLRNDLFSTQQIAHHDAHRAAAGDGRQVADGEGTGWHLLARGQRVVDKHIDGRGQHRFARHALQREADEVGLGRKIGGVLNAAKTRRAPPGGSGAVDAVAKTQAGARLGVVLGPGGVKAHEPLASIRVSCQETAYAHAIVTLEETKFEQT